MRSPKDQAREIIDRLPDTATLNDIMYELYVRQKIERGKQASEEGRVVPHTEVKGRYAGKRD